MTKHRALLTALAVLAVASLSLGRPAPVSASTGPNLTISCPSTVVQGTTFDCLVGWGAITPGSEPGSYQAAIVYNSPAVASGTPSGTGTAMVLNSITREYAAAAMWTGGSETCPAPVLANSSPVLPTGWVGAGNGCVEDGTMLGALLSPLNLLRFHFTAHGIGTTLVHLVPFSQGGALYGSYTSDTAAAAQTNTYSCVSSTCSATPFNTPDNTTSPIITIVPPYTGGISGKVYHDSVSPANALSGAVVHACPITGACASAYTDSAGAYTVRYLANGPYDVSTLDRDPYLGASIGSVSVSGGATTSGHDIVMTSPPGSISGTVYTGSATPGNELAGAAVGACPTAGGACRTTTANGAGVYSLPALADGSYNVTAVAPSTNFQHTMAPIVVSGGPVSGQDVVVVYAAGVITGHVYEDHIGGPPLAGGLVSACPISGLSACRTTYSDGLGEYFVDLLGDGSYTVSVFPPGGFTSNVLTPVVVVASSTTSDQNLVVTPPVVPPPTDGISPTNSAPGAVPVVFFHNPLTLTKTGCSGGTASYQVILNTGAILSSGSMPESPAGTYTAVIPPLFPNHDAASIAISLDCGSGPITNSWNLYIDPSGYVKTVGGAPIAGATVKLYRSDSPFGPFVQVPNNSAIMSPQNRTNPDTTDATGHFGWDVTAGYYQVRASKPGCVSAADPSEQVGTWRSYAETAVLEIPPPVFDLDLRLECDDADGDGYTNKVEDAIGGNSGFYCKTMRADVDDDGTVTILDLSKAAGVFGQPVPPAPARYDQGQFSRDNSINILDLSAMASVYGKPVSQCI